MKALFLCDPEMVKEKERFDHNFISFFNFSHLCVVH